MEARPYQIKADNAVMSEYDKGIRRMIVSSATGTGKSFILARLYESLKSRLPGQMLCIVHTEELVDQNIATLRNINPTVKVDKEMAEHRADPSAEIVVA